MRSTSPLAKQVDDQVKWMKKCGGSRTGYIARYGDANDPNKYGDGGAAIYDADMARLTELIDDLDRAPKDMSGDSYDKMLRQLERRMSVYELHMRRAVKGPRYAVYGNNRKMTTFKTVPQLARWFKKVTGEVV